MMRRSGRLRSIAIRIDNWQATAYRTIAALVVFPCCGAAMAADRIGQASVIDDDTLAVHGTRIRLWCIDAPESTQLMQ
ncbi:hypothetical protein [Bradyrhizobium pachyrhizi]|uniref:hypothetical protein n=1 Tax=Bradyrhizobium pachyrhizi TaxID=280333 RepID=UPI000A3F0136